MDVQALVGFGSAAPLIIALTDHLKRFMAAMPWTLDRANGAPWPLVSDFLGVLWALALWRGGLLAAATDFAGAADLRWPIVVLLGLALGVGSSALVDGKRSLRAPAARTTNEAHS